MTDNNEMGRRVRIRTMQRAKQWRRDHPDADDVSFEIYEDEFNKIRKSIWIQKYWQVPLGLVFCCMIFFSNPCLARAEYAEVMNTYDEVCELQRVLPKMIRMQPNLKLQRRGKRLKHRR